MATLAEVNESIKQITAGIADMRMELQQLQRNELKAQNFVGPLSPQQTAQRDAGLQRIQDVDDQMWEQTKRLHGLGRQRSQLAEAHGEQVSQGNALMNLVRHVPGGSGFAHTFGSISSLLGNVGKAFPAVGQWMQGAGILAGGATAAGGAGAAAGAGGGLAALGGGGSLVGALGAAAGLGPVGVAVAGTIAVGKELAELPGKIRDWTRSLAESQRYLAQFSGSMALVFAESEARDYWRNNRIGEATAGSTRFLSRQSGNLSDTLAPFESAGTNIKNVLGGMAAQQTTALIRAFAEISPVLSTIVMHLANMDKPEGGGALFSDWMENAAGFRKNVGDPSSIFSDPGRRPETRTERATRISGAFAINPLWGVWNLFH